MTLTNSTFTPSNQHARPLGAVMPHSPSDVDLSPIYSTTGVLEPEQKNDRAPRETPDQSLDSVVLRLTREQLEQVARQPAGQVQDSDALLVTAENANQFQQLLRHRAPVTRLPPEMLAHIFELYVGRSSKLTPNGDPLQSPFRLTQVCTYWKAVAELDPHLWTSIHLYFPESRQNRERDVPSVELVLDLHLKRSGVLPISLTFTDHRIYHPATEQLVSLLADRLRTYAQRWKDITLHLSCVYYPLLFTFAPCELPSLERFCITGDVDGCADPQGLHLNLDSATSIKSFSYSGPGQSTNTVLRWESLEEVSLGFVPHRGTYSTLSGHFKYLAQCQNITICSLGLDRTPWNMGAGLTITLPRLHTLRIRRLSPYAIAPGVIDPLILPRLQTLEIDASNLVGWNQPWHNHNFSDLLSRSGCHLLHLSIRDVDFPNDELMRCLELSPALTSFCFIPCPRFQNISDVIREMDVSRTVTHDRTRADGQEHVGHTARPLVPQLRKVTLGSSVNDYLDQMLAMIRARVGARARAAGVATLQRAEVVFFDLWHATSTDVDRVCDSEHRLDGVASFQSNLERLVSTNLNEERGHEEKLEASILIDSPYLPEYIDVR